MDVHYLYLYNLAIRLPLIGENPDNIESILTEPVWYGRNHHQMNSLCDIILLYRDRTASAIELKGSPLKRDKALLQLSQGYDFIDQVLNRKVKYGVFVVYAPLEYKYERFSRTNTPL